MTPGLFSYNANVKYPLSDFHEADVPNDILSDLTLAIGSTFDPVVGVIRTSPFAAFVAIQNRITGESIAIAAVANPIPGRVYPLEMDVDGFGWVVFGPGSKNRTFYTGSTEIDLDPEVITQLKNTAPKFAINVDDFVYDVTNILNILSNNDSITITVENGIIYIDRNDANLSETQVAAFTNITGANASELIFTIAGAAADDAGNIDIDVVGVAEPCDDVWALAVPRGDINAGTHIELPLDAFSARQFTDGNSCVTPDSSEFPDTGDTAQIIVKTDILDRKDDFPVGTLYGVDADFVDMALETGDSMLFEEGETMEFETITT